ncbi:hypothetical protein AVEN_150269-1 [Araneus ventricosus]|uniref:Uncharacterized protein n=1 Tax=Araneus ventricosus TaxID=182803 RepID=A0A4Y2HCY6_ARAVE|nr:hypothetical protein AVEN_150269-1 [Araneus ventricosus]
MNTVQRAFRIKLIVIPQLILIYTDDNISLKTLDICKKKKSTERPRVPKENAKQCIARIHSLKILFPWSVVRRSLFEVLFISSRGTVRNRCYSRVGGMTRTFRGNVGKCSPR